MYKTPEVPTPPTPVTPPVDTTVATAFTFADITVPEGFAVDETGSKDFIDTINDPALSKKDLAQKLIDMYAARERTAAEQGVTEFANLQQAWQDAFKADKEIGGPKAEATLAGVGKLIETYGTAEVREAFDVTGAGNNPHIIRFLHKMAQHMNEPGPISGAPSRSFENLPDRLYTHPNSKR